MRSRASLLALCLAFPSAASAPALPAAVSPPGVESVSSGEPVRLDPLDRRRIQRITEISAALLELDAEALDRAANTYRASAAQDLTLAIILRAGRPIPPGLAAARRAQRAARPSPE